MAPILDRMRYLRGRYLLVIGLLLSFLICFATGVMKIPEVFQSLGMTYRSPVMIQMTLIHDWTGVAMGALTAVHIFVHRRWIVAMTRRIVSGR
jgi:cytochrome b subunit of formate dehydrogenase